MIAQLTYAHSQISNREERWVTEEEKFASIYSS